MPTYSHPTFHFTPHSPPHLPCPAHTVPDSSDFLTFCYLKKRFVCIKKSDKNLLQKMGKYKSCISVDHFISNHHVSYHEYDFYIINKKQIKNKEKYILNLFIKYTTIKSFHSMKDSFSYHIIICIFNSV